MKMTKKALSVLLAVMMIVTSCACAFGVSAAGEDPLEKLAAALKSDTVKTLSTRLTASQSGSGTNDRYNNFTYTMETYDDYLEMLNVLECLDNVINSTKKYTSSSICVDGGAESNTCINMDDLYNQIVADLSDYMTAQEISQYNIKTFLLNIFSMNQVTYKHPDGYTGAFLSGKNDKVPSNIFNIVKITTNDYKGYLATKNSYKDVESAFATSAEHQFKMIYANWIEKGLFGVITNHYHNALSKNNPPVINKINGNTTVRQTLDAYASYVDTVDLDMTYEEMLNKVQDHTLQPLQTEFVKKYNDIVNYVGGKATFDKLYSDKVAAIENFMKGMASAMDVETYLAIADQWNEYVANHPNYGVYNYGAYDYDEMLAAYNDFLVIYDSLKAGGDELLVWLDKYGHIDIDYYNNFTDNIVVYNLADVKDKADKLYNENKDTYEDLSDEEKGVVYGLLCGYIASISEYSEQVQNTIFPDGYQYLLDLQSVLYCEVNPFVMYFSKVLGKPLENYKTNEIKNIIAEIPENLKGLHDFFDVDLVDAAGAERADELLADFVAEADALSAKLFDLLAGRFTSQVEFADGVYKSLGEITEVNVETYLKLKAAFDNLDESIYTYLGEQGKMDLLSQETIDTYLALKASIYDRYLEFAKTFGFSTYKQSHLEYASRPVYANDMVKTEDFDVTREDLEATIAKLDALLASDDFKSLTGLEGDLGTMVKDLLGGFIYSDSVINAVVGMLYPLIIGEFSNVFDNLPVETDITDPISVHLTIGYKKDMHQVLSDIGLNAFPDLLANALPNQYADAKAALASAKQNWEHKAIYDRDAGALTLNWGVDDAAPEEKADVFYRALADALVGLKPLVSALLMGQDWASGTSSEIARANGSFIVSINARVDLKLFASANDGFVNALAPIFEMLGVKNLPTADQIRGYTDLEQLARAIFEPLMARIDEIMANPVDEVLGLLPNLLYALSFDMVTPILSMLKTKITYEAWADDLPAGMAAMCALTDSIDINVGEMFDLASLGLDLSKGLPGILELAGLSIPEIDSATVATLGELTTKDTVRTEWIYDHSAIGNKAYTIAADKADVAYYVLTYVVNLIKDEEAFRNLLSMFVQDKDQVDSIIWTFQGMNISQKPTGDSIGALIELINPVKYLQTTYKFPEYVAPEEVVEPDWDNMTEEEIAELEAQGKVVKYSKYWTKGKAEYVTDNLIPMVEKACNLFGIDITDEITNLLENFYTVDTVNQLVELLGGAIDMLFANATVGSVVDTISMLADIDVSGCLKTLKSFDCPAFEDGDRDGFVNALTDYLMPVMPVLKLFLIDGATPADSSKLTLLGQTYAYGYDGYDNALIPLLETIGCKPENITKYDEFVNLSDREMLAAVFNPILALVDEISADPINGVIGLLPNILYFVSYGGAQMAVEAIVEPLYVLFDVLRPVVNVDLPINLNLEEMLTDLLANATDGLSLKVPGFSELSRMIQSLGTLEEYDSANDTKGTRLTVEESLTPEFITIVLRTAANILYFADNTDTIFNYVKENKLLDGDALRVLRVLLDEIDKREDVDMALFVFYYLFFGVNTGVDHADKTTLLVSDAMRELFDKLGGMESSYYKELLGNVGLLLNDIGKWLDDVTGDDTGAASDFFGRIAAFFQSILDWFFRLFVRK